MGAAVMSRVVYLNNECYWFRILFEYSNSCNVHGGIVTPYVLAVYVGYKAEK